MTDIIERLREQPKMSIFANIGDMVGRLNHEREEAADEIERLRSALRGIRDYEGNFPVIYDGDDAIAMKEIARAALGEKE